MKLFVIVFILLVISSSYAFVVNHARGITSKFTMLKNGAVGDGNDRPSTGLVSIISPNPTSSKVEQLTSIYDVLKPSFIGNLVLVIIIITIISLSSSFHYHHHHFIINKMEMEYLQL